MSAADERAKIGEVIDALEMLRSGKAYTRFELFPNSGNRVFQKKVTAALVEHGVLHRKEIGDPKAPTVQFILKSRRELERLINDEVALSRLIWPGAVGVSDKPPEMPPMLQVVPDPVETLLNVVEPETPPTPEPAKKADAVAELTEAMSSIKELTQIVSVAGQSIVYTRERLDELCRYLGQVLPELERKVDSLYKDLHGEEGE